MTKEELYDKYNPIHNTLQLSSPMENMMFERWDDEQLDYVESKEFNKVWSVSENGFIKNGRMYSNDIVGYLVCKNANTDKIGSIKISI